MKKMANILLCVAESIVKSLLWWDKKVVKGYFGIETPLYKLWWGVHRDDMQLKMRINAKRRDAELGVDFV